MNFTLLFRGISILSFFLISFSLIAKDKPNVIIFFTDDQGYADVGCYGAEGFETPHLDQLASEGIRFTDFYVPATVCTPSRAGLLTGRYPKRANLHEAVLFPFSEGGLSQSEYTLAEMFRESGYSTSLVGKWHLGHKPEYMPNNHGFDYFYGVPYSNDMHNHHYKHIDFKAPPLPFYRNEELIESGPDQRYLTKRYTEETIRIIEEKKEDKPFFIYLAQNMPHLPLFVSEKFEGKSELGLYGDVIMELDWSMGEIVKALKKAGEYENTIIVFTSDNGPRVGSAKPLRGQKAQTWDGGQRVPGIITWPALIPDKQVCGEVVTTMDLFPTLARVAGAKLPKGHTFDGRDILKLWKNPEKAKLKDEPLYFYARDGKPEAVRLGDWKLHISKTAGWNAGKQGSFPVSLYNLKEDIREENNLADQYPEKVAEMTRMIETFDKTL